MAGLRTMTVLRKEKGWTQFDVAREVGVTQTEISLYENGRAFPGAYISRRLIKLFQVEDINYLFMPYTEYLTQIHRENQLRNAQKSFQQESRDLQTLSQLCNDPPPNNNCHFQDFQVQHRDGSTHYEAVPIFFEDTEEESI